MTEAKSLAVVLEWENAQALEREEALGLLRDLAARVASSALPLAKPATILLIFDEGVNADALQADVAPIAAAHAGSLDFEFVLARETPYYAKKGLAPFVIERDLFLYADSDCAYSPTWMEDLLRPILGGEVAVVYGDTVARPGANLVERACSIAWFVPLDTPRDPLRAKGRRRFFANNFAATGAVLRRFPIVRHGGSRAHGAAWLATLTEAGVPVVKVESALATHKQYGDLRSFFARAWLFGKDKDVAVALENPSPAYRLRRASAAVFELHAKYQRRFFRVAGRSVPAGEWVPAWCLGVGFQVVANLAQFVACARRAPLVTTCDYSDLAARAELMGG